MDGGKPSSTPRFDAMQSRHFREAETHAPSDLRYTSIRQVTEVIDFAKALEREAAKLTIEGRELVATLELVRDEIGTTSNAVLVGVINRALAKWGSVVFLQPDAEFHGGAS